LSEYPGGNSTKRILVEWFDFWLKGLGTPDRLAIVDHQASDGSWRNATDWPPPESREEKLYLAAAALANAPGAATTYRATIATHPPGCGYGKDPPSEGALLFTSAPLDRVTIAGNPYAALDLTSDQKGGVFALGLYDLDASGKCIALVAEGGADLRFLERNARGKDFPVGTPTPVHVDLFGTDHALARGHKLVLVVSSGENADLGQPQYAPQLIFGGASALVLPLVDGTLTRAS
jgi:predicted acyl esterase